MYDIFISHASEDKESIARPLAVALAKKGFRVWYDETELKLGDSLSKKIDEGLAQSKYGIVILSKAFFQKNWPERELQGLASREVNSGEKVILPIWHKITKEDILSYSPTLADKLAAQTNDGIQNIVEQITRVLGTPRNTKPSKDMYLRYQDFPKRIRLSIVSSIIDFSSLETEEYIIKEYDLLSEAEYIIEKIKQVEKDEEILKLLKKAYVEIDSRVSAFVAEMIQENP
jgi:hypothetical protein